MTRERTEEWKKKNIPSLPMHKAFVFPQEKSSILKLSYATVPKIHWKLMY